jgi:hypothetical protein
MGISLSDERIGVILIGSFDPDAVRAQKLAESGVIRAADLETLEYRGLLQGQISDYSLGWCSILVTRDRFAVESSQPPYVKICDLILKSLNELMPTAVASMFGINMSYKMNFSDSAARDRFGVRLVPPGEWGEWGKRISKQIEEGKVERHGGMFQATMREQPIDGREAGWRDVQIIADTPTSLGMVGGTALTVNDHFQLDLTRHPEGADAAETARRRTSALLQILSEQFQGSIDQSESIAKGLIKRIA